MERKKLAGAVHFLVEDVFDGLLVLLLLCAVPSVVMAKKKKKLSLMSSDVILFLLTGTTLLLPFPTSFVRFLSRWKRCTHLAPLQPRREKMIELHWHVHLVACCAHTYAVVVVKTRTLVLRKTIKKSWEANWKVRNALRWSHVHEKCLHDIQVVQAPVFVPFPRCYSIREAQCTLGWCCRTQHCQGDSEGGSDPPSQIPSLLHWWVYVWLWREWLESVWRECSERVV